MGARRKQNADDQAGTDVAILDADYSEHDTQIEDDQDAVEREILNEAGASENQVQYEIRVFRIPESGNTYPSLFTIPGENVAGIRDRLAQEYGTGHYELRVYKNRTLHRRLRIKIELPRAPLIAPPNNAGDAVAQAVLQQGKMLEALVTRLATSPPPPPPPAQNFADMFAGMAAMAKAMREITGPPPAPAPAINPLEMLSSVVTLVKDANNEGREKGIMDLVGDFLNSDVMKTVVQNLTPQQTAQPPQRQLAAPQPGAPNAPTPQAKPQPPSANAQPPAPPADPNEKAFRDLLDLLVNRAKKNADPGLYADFISDAIEEATLDQLLALPDPVAILAQYNPEVATHSVWFRSVLSMLTDDGEGETSAGAPNLPATAPDAVGSPAPAASADGPA